MTPNERAIQYVTQHELQGYHVDSRTKDHLLRGEIVVDHLIANEEEFFNLQFHANDATRLLTPHGQPRTLLDVVYRIQENSWDFSKLTKLIAGFNRSFHHPEWFNPCHRIETEGINTDSFGCLFLMDLTQPERLQTPKGSFSIYDGTHRSLVFAKLLSDRAINFQPIPSFIFRPRPLNA